MTTAVIPQVCVAELTLPREGLVGPVTRAARLLLSDLPGCPLLAASLDEDRLTVTLLLPARGRYPASQWRNPPADLMFWLRVALRGKPVVPIRIRALREATAHELLHRVLAKRPES